MCGRQIKGSFAAGAASSIHASSPIDWPQFGHVVAKVPGAAELSGGDRNRFIPAGHFGIAEDSATREVNIIKAVTIEGGLDR
jgi:hypothetical protein